MLLAGCVATAAVMAGASWLLTVSVKAHAEIRAGIAPASRGVMMIAQLPAEAIQTRPAVIAEVAPPRWSAPADTDVLKPVRVRSISIPGLFIVSNQSRNDGLTTASLDRSSGPAAEPAASPPVEGVQEFSLRASAPPLPRTRPKLASLQPPTDMGIAPVDETRSLKTAIYDITAQTVYLPNGERLEAHSGYGSMMDDPRYVHKKMRGATPPNTYRLTMREALFHGVEAIRMTPVGEGSMFGRDGILAHTYMLGPNGQSNGCVSFKNYPRFLQAFKRGEVERMVVVSRLDKPPTFVARGEPTRRNDDTL